MFDFFSKSYVPVNLCWSWNKGLKLCAHNLKSWKVVSFYCKNKKRKRL